MLASRLLARRGGGVLTRVTSPSLTAPAPMFGRIAARSLMGQMFPPEQPISPLPPREYEADGSLRKYPVNYVLYDHDFKWEQWTNDWCGQFHVVAFGDFGIHYDAKTAQHMNRPFWVNGPYAVFVFTVFISFLLMASSIGIKPLRFTDEWMVAQRQRERQENANPVTRYLDRRVAERGPHPNLGYYLPTNFYFMWMWNTHDHELREQLGLPPIESDE